MTPTPKPGVLDIAPYVGGRAAVAGVAEPIKLSSNESALGPSRLAWRPTRRRPRTSRSIPKAAHKFCARPSARPIGLDAARIVCGNGSDELLTMLANAYLRPGDEVLFSEHAFLVYRIATLANSAMPVAVPEKNLRVDVDAMLARVTRKDAAGLSRQSEQSDRNLSAARRSAPPACRPVARYAAGDRRRLCGICPPQRLRSRASRWWRNSPMW